MCNLQPPSLAACIMKITVMMTQDRSVLGANHTPHFRSQLTFLRAFAFSQIFGSIFWAALGRRVPVRFLLAAAAFVVAAAALATSLSASLPTALMSASAMGVGVGGLHLLVRLAWADYYGREHLGTIRGLAMSAQIGGQALGPVTSGFMFDATGSYRLPLLVYTIAAGLAGLMVLFATPPKPSDKDLAAYRK